MKSRWFLICLCTVLGLILLGCGLLIPVHLRATDASVVLSAGRTGDSLLDRGRALMNAGCLGTAEMFVSAAHLAQMPGWDRLDDAVRKQSAQNPSTVYWGTDRTTESVFHTQPGDNPFSGFIVKRENRRAALGFLEKSTSPTVQELLRCRALNDTVIFPASSSAAGQAFDAVVAECGLLLEGHDLSAKLSGSIGTLAAQANSGASTKPLEQVLMDLGSLGEHLNWDQLTAFAGQIPDVAGLHQVAVQVAGAGERLPLLFAAMEMTGEPATVADYMAKFPETGQQDIASGLWYGSNGTTKLVESGHRFYLSKTLRAITSRDPFGAIYYFAAARSLQSPWLVLAVKWLLYLGAGFCFAAALHFARRPVSRLELPLQVRGFHLLREFLFSLGFLLVVLLLSEPFLAQESQKGGLAFRLHTPMSGGAVAAGIAGIKETVMNPTVLITLLVFFVLQALIYISCLVKLAEIRRQLVPPRMKLKLLENEDHLFDAGLYLGFVGTIVSLIMASLGLVKFSLMAAYSSTSFGIIFVVIFKIFQLRPARRKLLLEAELVDASGGHPAAPTAPATAAEPALTT